MTVETQTNKAIFQGNDSTETFSYSFVIPAASDAVVTFTDSDGEQTVLTDAQYTITGIGDENGGTITYPLAGDPIATGESLTLERIVPYTQEVDLSNQGGYYPDVVEGMGDQIVYQTQQLAEENNRTIRFPAVDPEENADGELPAWQARAGLFFGFDASGNPAMVEGTGTTGPDLTDYTALAEDATVARPLGRHFGDRLCIMDFIPSALWAAIENGTITTNLASYLTLALAARGSMTKAVQVPAGLTLYFTTGITVGGNGLAQFLECPDGWATLKFAGLGATTDLVTLTAYGNQQIGLRNFLILNTGGGGRDALVITNGNRPIIENIQTYAAARDGMRLDCSGSNFIEQGYFRDIYLNTNGRHGFRMTLAGSGGAYINECAFYNCEVRGVSQITAGGSGVICDSTASDPGSKFGENKWFQLNMDAQAVTANLPSTYPMRITSGNAESWVVIGGGWENTGDSGITGGPLIGVTGSGSAGGWFVAGIVPSSWGQGYTGGPTLSVIDDPNLNQFRVAKSLITTGTTSYPVVQRNTRIWEDDTLYGTGKQVMQLGSDPTTEAGGIPQDGIMRAYVATGASSTATMTFSRALMSPSPDSAWPQSFILVLTSSQYAGSGSLIQRISHVMARPDLSAFSEWVIKDNSTANELASVAIASAATTSLAITITTGTQHSSSGGNQNIYGQLYRGGYFA